MEKIENIAKKSLESLYRDNLTEEARLDLQRELVSGAVALSLLVTGLLYGLIFPDKTTLPALLYTAGFLILGIPIFITALKGLLTRDITHAMEILVVIAITACYFSGEMIMAVLIPLVLNIAHILEERSIIGGRDVIDSLRRMQQGNAVILEGGKEIAVEATELKVGQHILIKPGVAIPIDGRVIEGESHIDQKSLTGEPKPFHARVGDKVYAGTVNLDGRVVVEVEKAYVDTSFSNILKFLENSENIAIPEARIIDRFMYYYIPFILATAAAVALVTRDVGKAVAMLVVSCPCGQMLVSSAPMIAALSAATRRGVLIKNSKFIEELTQIDTVVFDKTGTVTVGDLSLTDTVLAEGVAQEQLLLAAATVASASTHPISRALIDSVEELEFDRTYHVKEISGKGMRGSSQDGLHTIYFGSREWMVELGIAVPEDMGTGLHGSVSFVVMDGRLLGCLGFNDTVRPEAKEGIAALSELGVERTVMLTGDRQAAAEHICAEVGIDGFHAQLLPEDKMTRLKELKRDHCVLAVGDGINDALALKEADVGIAMGAMGSDLAIQSADIALMNNNLNNIPFCIKLAQDTRRSIYQNLVLSMSISAVMIGLSAFGVISALMGSFVHNVGAFAVLINSARILKKNK